MDENLTAAEQLTNAETMRHILTVRALVSECAARLVIASRVHDASKLEHPEVEAFTVLTKRLAKLEYGSEEYRACLREMKPAIEHHYQCNPHHPEHYPDGVLGMDLFDLLEMLCDWKAAGLRHEESSLRKSLEINAERFDMPPALVRILGNTLHHIEAAAGDSQLALSYPHVDDDD